VIERDPATRALHAVSRHILTHRELRQIGYDPALDPRVWDFVMDNSDRDLLRLRNLGVKSLAWLRANQPLRRDEVQKRLLMYCGDAGLVGHAYGLRLAERVA
jgi:hypothetical protein